MRTVLNLKNWNWDVNPHYRIDRAEGEEILTSFQKLQPAKLKNGACPNCGNNVNKPSNYCSECGQCLVKCI